MSEDVTATCEFTYEELQYALVMLSEGQTVVNESPAFKGFQNMKTQEQLIDKIRQKCWECHNKK